MLDFGECNIEKLHLFFYLFTSKWFFKEYRNKKKQV